MSSNRRLTPFRGAALAGQRITMKRALPVTAGSTRSRLLEQFRLWQFSAETLSARELTRYFGRLD